jgi:Zn-dependent peptidase ImmA (M78 family)
MSIDYIQPSPCGASKSAIMAFAEDLARKLSFGPGDPIEALIEKLGGKVSIRGLSDATPDNDESIVIDSDSKFEIFLSPLTSPERDRFTIAHELGHFFLHYPLKKKPMAAWRFGSTRVEWEANWFAAAFLMPEAEFKKKFAEVEGDIISVTSVYGVSTTAASIRAQTLGLRI